jgi:UDP-GlcNAc3NAcA epimerase
MGIKMKIITIVGARPQFIKAATVSRVFARYAENIKEIIIHTGQHFDKNMSEIFFKEMEIPMPQYNLNINGLSHGAMTGQMLEEIEKIVLAEKPDWLLVYGDTNSTLAGALAAKKLHVRVIHVEAGLRSFNNEMPEEINRILTDRISDVLFCPTETAVSNLMKEGYSNIRTKIFLSGDVMQDAALYYKNKSAVSSKVLEENGLKRGKYVLATIHRAENTDHKSRLREIVTSLNQINKMIRVVVPLHPRTSRILKDIEIEPEFKIIDPVGYFDMLQLISNCHLILTDSGGLQKEAYFFNKYCITLRDETEWVELVENGYNKIAGASASNIVNAFKNLFEKKFVKGEDLYGGGKAAETIFNEIVDFDRSKFESII